MMALNDLSLADDGLGRWEQEANPRLANRKLGGKRYFLRTLLSHVFEALAIIKEIMGDVELRSAVDTCDATTQASFEKLVTFLGSDDYKLLLKIRNNLAFHYGARIVQQSIVHLAEKIPNKLISCSMGDEAINWHFVPGEWVENDIIVRAIFAIEDADKETVQSKTNEITVRLHDIVQSLADFGGHFIKSHCQVNV